MTQFEGSVFGASIPIRVLESHVGPDGETVIDKAEVIRWQWLRSTVELQRDHFRQPVGDRSTAEVAASLKDNSFAIQVELAEASVEYKWKHWSVDPPYVNRERVLAELVDVGHFLANMLVAIGVTDEEWEAAYQEKQQINRDRMASKAYSDRKGGLGDGSD